MADTKITALSAITTVDPANDVLPIVDVSDTSMAASGTTKKITTNQLLGASGTATLASATITGNLTAAAVIPSGSTVPTNGLYLPTANNLGFAYNSTLGMTLNSSGLGIGAVPVNTRLDVRFPTNPTVDNAGGSHALRVWTTVAQAADVGGQLGLGGLYDATNYQSFATVSGRKENSTSGNNAGYFSVATCLAGGTMVERLHIDSSGNVGIGVTPSGGNRLMIQNTTDCTVVFKSSGANVNSAIDYVSNYGNHTIRKSGTAVWDYGVINDASATPAFKVSNASAVGVQLVSGATSWTTLSDETMKDIIEPISNAVAKVGSLRSVIGKFKTDDSSKRRSFLIAQDVQSVLPEAVDVIGENNELGLRYTEVIPLLVAAIKELTAEVNALKNA